LKLILKAPGIFRGFLVSNALMNYIKIKQKHWQRKRTNHVASWMEAIKIGLFSLNLKTAFDDKDIIPAVNFSNYQLNKNRGQQ
jgi:hypothetical protein